MKSIVYQTTNSINGKTYIGVHECNKLSECKYLGSGLSLKRAIRKYGRNNFTREILYELKNKKQALRKEKQIVNRDFVLNPKTYNLKIGGGIDHSYTLGFSHSDESKQKISQNNAKYWKGKSFSEEHKKKIRSSTSQALSGRVLSEEHKLNLSKTHTRPWKGKTFSLEHRQKLSLAHQKNKLVVQNEHGYNE